MLLNHVKVGRVCEDRQFSNSDEAEKAANAFALALVMPERVLRSSSPLQGPFSKWRMPSAFRMRR